jgi:hypothetical protein
MTLYLAPPSVAQFEDANGAPYSGAKLFTYAAGSTTKLTTYQTSSGTANTNPIVLDSKGRPPYAIWLTGGLSYKFHLAPSTDSDPPIASALFSLDNVTGVNDVGSATINEWTPSGLTPTYISSTSFSFTGDQTSTYTVGRRLKSSVSGGTAYSTIKSSVFTTLTTITVANDSTALDSGISGVSYGILASENQSIPPVLKTFSATATTSDQLLFTLTTMGDNSEKPYVLKDGMTFEFLVPSNNISGGVTVNIDGFGAKQVINRDLTDIRKDQISTSYFTRILYSSAFDIFFLINDNVPANVTYQKSYERQSINFAPVDSNGYTSLGGSTGGTTVVTTAISASAPFTVNAANGLEQDYLGYSADNLTWDLGATPSNGTWYAFVDVSSYGGLTPEVLFNVAPVYQYSGTPSVTNGQMTFDATKMQCFVGNGSSAEQAYRVCVGEFTVAANVVSAIKWYRVNRGKRQNGILEQGALASGASKAFVFSTLDEFQSVYNSYELELNHIQPDADNKQMWGTISDDAGSTYAATGYDSVTEGTGATNSTTGAARIQTQINQAQGVILGVNGGNGMSNAANETGSVVIRFQGMNSGTSLRPHISWNGSYYDNTGTAVLIHQSGSMSRTTAGDYDAFKLTFESAANFTGAGTYELRKIWRSVYETF